MLLTVCTSSWGGDACQLPVSCITQSQAKCTKSNGYLTPISQSETCGSKCVCNNFWMGSKCETCPLQCLNNGIRDSTCNQCGCTAGFTGQRCQCKATAGMLTMNGFSPILLEYQALEAAFVNRTLPPLCHWAPWSCSTLEWGHRICDEEYVIPWGWILHFDHQTSNVEQCQCDFIFFGCDIWVCRTQPKPRGISSYCMMEWTPFTFYNPPHCPIVLHISSQHNAFCHRSRAFSTGPTLSTTTHRWEQPRNSLLPWNSSHLDLPSDGHLYCFNPIFSQPQACNPSFHFIHSFFFYLLFY